MHLFKVALTLGIAALCGVSASFGAGVIYQQTSGTGLGLNSGTVPYALDDVNFATGSTAVRQELSAMTFGVGVLANTTAQTAVAFIDFYDTVNSASAGAVNTVFLGGFSVTFNIAATGASAGAQSFNVTGLQTLPSPIFFNDNSVGYVLTLANSAGNAYSTVITPLYSNPGAPTVGTSTTGIYRDTNNDGTFQAGEFFATQGNLYVSITTINAPVPEPTTWAMVAGGLGTLVVAMRRRRA